MAEVLIAMFLDHDARNGPMRLVYVSSMAFNTMQHPYTTTIAQNLVLRRRMYAGHTERNNE